MHETVEQQLSETGLEIMDHFLHLSNVDQVGGDAVEQSDPLQDSLAHLRPIRIGPAQVPEDLESSTSTESGSRMDTQDRSADGYENLLDIYKYVDDTTLVETTDTRYAVRHLTTNRPTATSRATFSEVLLDAVQQRAEDIGMKVNCAKTQLLLISQPNGYEKKAFVTTSEEERVNSGKTLKLLGFVFGEEPNMNAHVKEIQRKFRARFWALRPNWFRLLLLIWPDPYQIYTTV